MHDSAIVSFTWQHLLRRFLLSGILVLPLCVRAQDILKINGSTTVNLPVAEAAEILRSERWHVDPVGHAGRQFGRHLDAGRWARADRHVLKTSWR